MSSTGGLYLIIGAFLINAYPKEITPILPTNIRTQITNFPPTLRSLLIPVDNPTVLNAEADSNINCSKSKLSLSISNNANMPMNKQNR